MMIGVNWDTFDQIFFFLNVLLCSMYQIRLSNRNTIFPQMQDALDCKTQLKFEDTKNLF